MEVEKETYPPKVDFSAKKEYGVDIPTVNSISTYKEDFQGAPAKRSDSIHFEPDYPDILAGPYNDPLRTDVQIYKDQLDPTIYRKAEDLYDKFTRKYPTLMKKALQSPVDQNKIIDEFASKGKTVYQIDFCRTGNIHRGGSIFIARRNNKPRNELLIFTERHKIGQWGRSGESKKGKTAMNGKKSTIKLPDDWYITRSVQQRSYINLCRMQDLGLLSFEMGAEPFPPGATSLGFTSEEHKVLETNTGETEYQEYISNSGRHILKEAFYGEIKPLPREFRNKIAEGKSE